MIRRYAGFFLVRGVARIIWWLLRVTVFVAAMILAAPVVLVAAYSVDPRVVPGLAAAPPVPGGGLVPADAGGVAGRDGR